MSLCVGSWEVGDQNITLLQEGASLKYEVSEEGSSKTSMLSSDLISLYGLSRAKNLINIFNNVIKINLRDQVSSQAFLPVLCTEGFEKKENEGKTQYEPTNLQVALFGQFGTPSPEEISRRIVGARWGIYNPSGKVTSYIDLDAAATDALSFLQNVPLRSSKQEYSAFAKRFRPVLLKDSDGRIVSIALRCMSIFDSNVVIDEQNWAVTVLHADHGSGFSGVGFGPNLGHSMLAIEGMKDKQPFVQYAHITTRSIPGFDDGRKSNEARVEIIKDRVLKSIIPAKTWVRPRDEVSKMLEYVEAQQTNKRYVNFSMTGGVIADCFVLGGLATNIVLPSRIDSCVASIAALAIPAMRNVIHSSLASTAFYIRRLENADGDAIHYNCAGWVVEILKKAGIQLMPTTNQDVFRLRFLTADRRSITLTPKTLVQAINAGEIMINVDVEEQ